MLNSIIRDGYVILAATLVGLAVTYSANINALPFPVFDARSAGLAGVGVAARAHNALFFNPALTATNDEKYDWIVIGPGIGKSISDPNELEDRLDEFATAAKDLALSQTPLNEATAGNALSQLSDKVYREKNNIYLATTIPSTVLSGSGYFMKYDDHFIKASIGGDNLSAMPPAYQSTLEHQGISVIEGGFSVAKLSDISMFDIGELQIGLTAKLMLVKIYDYSELIDKASLDFDGSQAQRSSNFNIDIGVAKQYGVWNSGLVVRNLLSTGYDSSNGNESFSLGPQVRWGFAYQSRRSLFEVDIDLTRNDGIGPNAETAYAALGYEYRLFSKTYIRLGYRQNTIGDETGVGTLGFGLNLWGLTLDLAVISGDDEDGAFGRLGIEF